MNKQEFLLKLKDPVEYGVRKSLQDMERIFPFVNDTRLSEVYLGTGVKARLQGHRVWHVDIIIDIEAHRKWDNPSKDTNFNLFGKAVEQLLTQYNTIPEIKVSDYLFERQMIITEFHTL